jgi:hypothetical protein
MFSKKTPSASPGLAHVGPRLGPDSHILTTIPRTVKHPRIGEAKACFRTLRDNGSVTQPYVSDELTHFVGRAMPDTERYALAP